MRFITLKLDLKSKRPSDGADKAGAELARSDQSESVGMARSLEKPSKWVQGLKPGMTVSDAAVATIRQRLDSVFQYLPLAAKRSDENVEYVHQLRVASRRVTAALDLFRDLLPARRAKRLRKLVRKLRRSAGDARDLDVMLIRFRSRSEASPDRNFERIIRQLKKKRKQAQKQIVIARTDAKQCGLKNDAQQLLRRIKRSPDSELSFQDVAIDAFEQSAAEFFRHVEPDAADPTALHEMRIAGKSLRYTMEIVHSAFDTSFRTKLYPMTIELQDAFGSISDRAAAAFLFEKWSDKSRTGRKLQKLARAEQALVETEIVRFHQAWPFSRLRELEASCQVRLEAAREASSL